MSPKTFGLTDELDVLVSTNALMVIPFRSVTFTKGSFLHILISSSEWIGLETAAEVWPLISAAPSFPTGQGFLYILASQAGSLESFHEAALPEADWALFLHRTDRTMSISKAYSSAC